MNNYGKVQFGLITMLSSYAFLMATVGLFVYAIHVAIKGITITPSSADKSEIAWTLYDSAKGMCLTSECIYVIIAILICTGSIVFLAGVWSLMRISKFMMKAVIIGCSIIIVVISMLTSIIHFSHLLKTDGEIVGYAYTACVEYIGEGISNEYIPAGDPPSTMSANAKRYSFIDSRANRLRSVFMSYEEYLLVPIALATALYIYLLYGLKRRMQLS